jgi:hypothetical protein
VYYYNNTKSDRKVAVVLANARSRFKFTGKAIRRPRLATRDLLLFAAMSSALRGDFLV